MFKTFSVCRSSLSIQRMSLSTKVRSTASSGSQVYESKRAVQEYLLFHYGKDKDIIPFDIPIDFALSFTQRSALLCQQSVTKANGACNRVLDVGCAVGGLSFELSKYFNEVVGIDFSQSFVDAANEMKETKSKTIEIMKQGENFFQTTVSIPSDANTSKVNFFQGDACNLDPKLGKFDLIVGSNLLCRLPNPRKFLEDACSLHLNPNGILLLISPYSWLEEYTNKSEWVGAQNNKDSFDVLRDFVESDKCSMKLIHRENVSFLIREHERKYQLGVSDGTVWLKNN